MSRRIVTLAVFGLLIITIGLELSGSASGLGMQTLPLLILLAAGLFISWAVWPERGARTESALAIPLEGATGARLDLTFGAGNLTLKSGAPEETLISGTVSGTVRQDIRQDAGVTHITLRQPQALVRRRATWELALPPAVEWAGLHLMLGAAEAQLDLRGLAVHETRIEAGGTTLEATLPATGAIAYEITGGRATLLIPPGAAVTIHSEIRLGAVEVDETHFTPDGSGYGWTAGDPDASERLQLALKGGLGTVEVRAG